VSLSTAQGLEDGVAFMWKDIFNQVFGMGIAERIMSSNTTLKRRIYNA
jgi:uncharacterized membrane protein